MSSAPLGNMPSTWNQKNLDYEIETLKKLKKQYHLLLLEIKRTSITRLKHISECLGIFTSGTLEIKRTSITRLKQNIGNHIIYIPVSLEIKRTSITRLKQDIEVISGLCEFPLEIKRTSITRLKLKSGEILITDIYKLEIKRTSITRLKLWNGSAAKVRAEAWNQKNLDYEIETYRCPCLAFQPTPSWNQKNLDYEIETAIMSKLPTDTSNLKSKEPRLRDWNTSGLPWSSCTIFALKSKEPRLRDWNSHASLRFAAFNALEIKRTSITRLKRGSGGGTAFRMKVLKSKEPRLRDWNSFIRRYKNFVFALKSKEPRLRDWNFDCISLMDCVVLDLKSKEPRLRDWNTWRSHCLSTSNSLEIKRTSITRLKLQITVAVSEARPPSWNQKNLDYEIET